jgi:hypothetical protein
MVTLGTSRARSYWEAVIRRTYSGGYTGESPLTIWKALPRGGEIPRPDDADGILIPSVGELKGQTNDWRASLDRTIAGFHAVEFQDRYECHMDAKDPFKDPLGHLVEDSPGTLVAVGAIAVLGIAAAIAYALSRGGDSE